MANLYEILADAQNGEAMTAVGREFGLSPQHPSGRGGAAARYIDGPQANDGNSRRPRRPTRIDGSSARALRDVR